MIVLLWEFMGERDVERIRTIYELPTADRAVHAIADEIWYGAGGRHGELDADLVLRCVTFLKTDCEYQWPEQGKRGGFWPHTDSALGCAFAALWLIPPVGLAAYLWRRKRRHLFTKAGDIAVWPFISNAEYAAHNEKSSP
jgi:hypothetical protein